MKYGLYNVYSTQALISREACFYNSMETRVREISCLPDLILKRKQNNFSTNRNKCVIIVVLTTKLRKYKTKREISIERTRKPNYFVV